MKAKLLYSLLLLAILLLLTACNKNPFSKDSVRTVETLEYSAMPEEDIIDFNYTNGSTVVMMGKYLPDNETYKFMYLIKSGVWIGTNTTFGLGDTLRLDQMDLRIIPTLKDNGNKNTIK